MSAFSSQKLASLACKYLEYLALQKTCSSHTSKSYAIDLSQFLNPTGVVKIASCIDKGTDSANFHAMWRNPDKCAAQTTFELIHLIRESQKQWCNLSPASKNRKAAVIRSFLKWLLHEKHIEEDFSHKLVSPKVPQKLPHFLSVDEALTLIRSLKPGRAQTLVLLLYGTGMRVSEACSLKWSDLQPQSQSLRVVGKGGHMRLITAPGLVWKVLQDTPKDGEYVLGSDSMLNTRKAYELVRQAGAHASLLKPLHPHALRHSYATHLLTSGADLRVLQELLGHRSMAATQKYTHLTLDHLARSMEKHHPLSASKLKSEEDLD